MVLLVPVMGRLAVMAIQITAGITVAQGAEVAVEITAELRARVVLGLPLAVAEEVVEVEHQLAAAVVPERKDVPGFGVSKWLN